MDDDLIAAELDALDRGVSPDIIAWIAGWAPDEVEVAQRVIAELGAGADERELLRATMLAIGAHRQLRDN